MKFLKWLGIVLAALILIGFVGGKILRSQTKKHSPEDTVTFSQGDLELSVFYNRPYKKEREIFGGLVPYGEVWRTGANEATTFTTNQAISVGGSPLPAGKYTLWTIPEENDWMVIFNSELYDWGVSLTAKASREAEHDVLQVKVPVERLAEPIEQFTIAFEEGAMTLAWDKTKVSVPLE